MNEDLIALKKNYLSALENILELTQNLSFDDDDKSCEKFVNLMDNRNVYFDYLKKLSKSIDDLSYDGNDTEVKSIDTKIKETAKKIYELDQSNMAVTEKMLSRLKQNLKGSKINTKIFSAYNNVSVYENFNSNFDSKQ